MGLLSFFDKIPNTNEISGSFGEWMAKIYLKTLPGALVLPDVLIDGVDGYTSQIDLIVIGNRGIYVVEMKMFDDAKIYGDTKKQKWNYYKHGKKYEIYSPLKQNQKHIEYLKTFLKEFGEIPFFSIITMICEDFKISGETDGKTVVCNSFPAMERGFYKIAEHKPEVLDDVKKHEIFDYIKNNQHMGKEAGTRHKKNVAAYKEALEEMKTQKICPYCKLDSFCVREKTASFMDAEISPSAGIH